MPVRPAGLFMICVLFASSLWPRMASASPVTPGQLTLSPAPHRLLGDLLRARFPADTTFRNSASGEIAPPDGTMTFLVERAGTAAGRLTLAAIKKHEQPFTPRWTGRAAIKLRLAPGWEGQLFPAARTGASVVAYVRAPDRWVYRVWFHVAAERRSAEWTALARRIAESSRVAPGVSTRGSHRSGRAGLPHPALQPEDFAASA